MMQYSIVYQRYNWTLLGIIDLNDYVHKHQYYKTPQESYNLTIIEWFFQTIMVFMVSFEQLSHCITINKRHSIRARVLTSSWDARWKKCTFQSNHFFPIENKNLLILRFRSSLLIEADNKGGARNVLFFAKSPLGGDSI